MLNASLGAAKSGYLSTDQLRQLCIHKGVFSSGINRMEMINHLVKGQCFAAEAAEAAGSSAGVGGSAGGGQFAATQPMFGGCEDDDEEDDEDEEEG